MEKTMGKKTKKMSRRMRLTLRIIISIVAVIGMVVGVILGFRYATYDYVQEGKNYSRESTDDSKYIEYEDGVLEYSRDGIALLTLRGEELWNQPCQISNPIAETCEKAAAVADKGGTSILVFQKNGLKGEIQTTRPIEKIAVSSQGIVAVILQDEKNPLVICYDAKGNVLVEQKTSLKNTGYPVDIALSEDGEVLLVSYLCTAGGGVYTQIRFYHFGQAGEVVKNHVVAQKAYEDSIAPITKFLNQSTSLVVSDSALILYKGLDKPQESVVVPLLGEVQGVDYNDRYIAVTLQDSGKSGNELRLYNLKGKLVMSTKYDGEYTNLKVTEGQIVLYEDTRCLIYTKAGVCKFRGTVEKGINDIFKISGLNKYMVINAEGFQEIQLAK